MRGFGRGESVIDNFSQKRTDGHCSALLRDVVRERAVVDGGAAIHLQATALPIRGIGCKRAAVYQECGRRHLSGEGLTGRIEAGAAITYDGDTRGRAKTPVASKRAVGNGDDVLSPETAATTKRAVGVEGNIGHGERAQAPNATTAELRRKSVPYVEPTKRESASRGHREYSKSGRTRPTDDRASIAENGDRAADDGKSRGAKNRIVHLGQYLPAVRAHNDSVGATATVTNSARTGIGIGRVDGSDQCTSHVYVDRRGIGRLPQQQQKHNAPEQMSPVTQSMNASQPCCRVRMAPRDAVYKQLAVHGHTILSWRTALYLLHPTPP
ncbi:MAG: hypothetical protein H0V62_09045 [Gammaproteobacteria bacterium]|nr:hypothetical protein [Gammaproteobacteria bacterium]